jgi:hypothetical protein
MFSLKESNNAFLAHVDNAGNKMAWLNRIVDEGTRKPDVDLLTNSAMVGGRIFILENLLINALQYFI